MTVPGAGGHRIPEAPSEAEAAGQPDLDGALPGKEITGDGQEGVQVPLDHPVAVEDFGTTAAEEAAGESLDGRLARELPDVFDDPDAPPVDPAGESVDDEVPFVDEPGLDVGRLVADDEGVRADTEADLVARSVGTDRGGFSAEEAAMHLDPDS